MITLWWLHCFIRQKDRSSAGPRSLDANPLRAFLAMPCSFQYGQRRFGLVATSLYLLCVRGGVWLTPLLSSQ